MVLYVGHCGMISYVSLWDVIATIRWDLQRMLSLKREMGLKLGNALSKSLKTFNNLLQAVLNPTNWRVEG